MFASSLFLPECVGNHSCETSARGLCSSIFAGTSVPHALAQLSLSYSFFFFSFSKERVGELALLWACSCIWGFLAGSQEANKTLLYLGGVGAAFRLTCRRWDETQRSHTITAFYSMNEQRPLEMACSQPGGSAEFLQSRKSPNTKSHMNTEEYKKTFYKDFLWKIWVIQTQSSGLKLIIACLKGLHCLFIIIATTWQVFLKGKAWLFFPSN